MPSRLSRYQRKLSRDIDAILGMSLLNHREVLDWDADARTPVLANALRAIVIGKIVQRYTLIDEGLSTRICNYMFRRRDFIRLWRTEKFARFNYYVLEKLSLMEKLAFVRDVYQLPKAIVRRIEAINALRNALAHAFCPENLRVYSRRKSGKAQSIA